MAAFFFQQMACNPGLPAAKGTAFAEWFGRSPSASSFAVYFG
jgi:hypothetical protein